MQNQSNAETVLTADKVTRSFRSGRSELSVLKEVSLQVRLGECVFLCGASGAGKTTLLNTLAGLERPQGGTITFENHTLDRLSEDRLARLRNERMGFVFQGFFLLPELTALENVLLPALISGRREKSRAVDLLKRVGLGGRLNHLPSQLSGGEQQRVAIARALINDPAVIFADEPTGNLDKSTGHEIMELLLGLRAQDSRTLLIVTHDLTLAAEGDRRLTIEDGSILGEQQ